MIHKAINKDDFLTTVSDTLGVSGKKNRWVTVGYSVEKKAKDGSIIRKICKAQFEIGSSYFNRMIKPHREGDSFQMSGRKPVYNDYNENGTVRSLISNPDQKYIWIWKSAIDSMVEAHIDSNGNILSQVDVDNLIPEGKKDAPRCIKMENVWYVSANGQTIVSEDYGLYKAFIDNI